VSGRVPPSSRAGTRSQRFAKARSRDARRSADIYESFTGHEAEAIDVIDIPPIPDAVAVIGTLDAVEYTTVREGKTELYRHKFRAKDRPLLCVSPDRRQILIVGGGFQFTDRGIVDDSDSKNQPD